MTGPTAAPIEDLLRADFLDVPPRQRIRLQRHFARNATTSELDFDWPATPYTRIALMNHLAALDKDTAYLEIGCHMDTLFAALPLVDKTGVDPARGGTHRMTSDAFFAQNERQSDLIWIDGRSPAVGPAP